MFRDTNSDDTTTKSFFDAIAKNDHETVEDMLERKLVLPNLNDEQKKSALQRTILFYPNPKMAEILLRRGANPNASEAEADAKQSSPIKTLISTAYLLYNQGELVDKQQFDAAPEKNAQAYENYKKLLELANYLEFYGAKITSDESDYIQRLATNHPILENFRIKIVDIFTNNIVFKIRDSKISEKKIKLSNVFDLNKPPIELLKNPYNLDSVNDVKSAANFIETTTQNLQIANQLLSGIIMRNQGQEQLPTLMPDITLPADDNPGLIAVSEKTITLSATETNAITEEQGKSNSSSSRPAL